MAISQPNFNILGSKPIKISRGIRIWHFKNDPIKLLLRERYRLLIQCSNYPFPSFRANVNPSFRSKYKQDKSPETNPSLPCMCHNTLFCVGIKTSNSYKASKSIKNTFGSSAYYNQTIHIEMFYYTNNNMENA